MTRGRTDAASPPSVPDLSVERSLVGPGRFVAGCDEVGRGALAGPVSVGLVVVDLHAVEDLPGIRDSKLLTPAAREVLHPLILRWAAASAVGHASAAEIDTLGLMQALHLAGSRAWTAVLPTLTPDVVVLDGNIDWLSARPSSAEDPPGCTAPVHPRIKADLTCLSVAAASVLAKVERDALMISLAEEHPLFGWETNKGYGTERHRSAIAGSGPSSQHRRTWRLDRTAVTGTGTSRTESGR